MKSKQILQLIFSKTLLFLAILIFVNLFGIIFGSANTLLGVSTLTLALSLMGQNLLPNPWRNLSIMVLFNLLLGFAAFLVPINLWFGLLINFMVIFAIGYFFSFTIRRSLTLLVGLHYLFLLHTPIALADAPLRLLALLVGPLIIMGLQLFIHSNTLKKAAANTLSDWQAELNLQLDQHVLGVPFNFQPLLAKISAFKVIIHDATPTGHALNDYQNALLTSASIFEYLAEMLTHAPESISLALGKAIKIAISQILTDPLAAWQENWNAAIVNEETPMKHQLNALLVMLAESITQCHDTDPKQKTVKLPTEFTRLAMMRRNFSLQNMNVRFALRLAIVIALAFFITDFWELTYGRWLIFTLFSLTQPYSEATIERSKKRFIGTLVGSVIGFTALTLVPNPDDRLLLILLFGYLSSYAADYRNTMIFVTITAVSSVALYSADPAASFLIRIAWIALGMFVALIASQLLFKTSYRDEARDLADLQTNIEEYEFQQLFSQPLSQTNTGYFYSLAPTIANRLASSHQTALTSRYQLHTKRILYLHQLFATAHFVPEIFSQVKQITTSTLAFNEKYEQLQYLRATASSDLAYHCATIASQLYTTANDVTN